MGDSEQEVSDEMPVPQIKRGRPAGKSDSTQRTRRTAQEISDDKIRVAQMKLDAVREAEERKLAARKIRNRPEKAAKPTPIVQEISIPARSNKPREDSLSPSPKHVTYANRKQALYDSFFTPQRRYWYIKKQCLENR